MKPFNLEQALAGEPVLLLNNNNPPLKAYLSRSKLRDDGIIFELENENRTVLRHSEKWLESFGTNIVMWEENNDEGEFKMKPFDLEKALAGEPVRLRDGTKAYVKYVMPYDYEGDYPIMGFYKYRGEYAQCSWTKDGRYNTEHKTSNEDIIGMWEEPRPRVQLDLPAPLKERKEDMWFIMGDRVFKSDVFSSTLLKTGKYFATKEDAEEWINAMKGARR